MAFTRILSGLIGHKGKRHLRGEDEPVAYTPEQEDEYLRCAADPIYFITHWVKVVHVDRGLVLFDLYDYQRTMIELIHNNRFVVCKCPRQVGKSSVITAYFLWFVLFHDEKQVAILANKLTTARELMGRLQKAYEQLPKWLQQGVKEWNKGSIELSNGSKVFADATSGAAIRGKSMNMILLDEFAHVEAHKANEFFASTYPTISSGVTTKVFVVSTPKGLNEFYKLWDDAVKEKNDYKFFEVHWSEVPGRDEKWKEQQIRNTSQQQFDQEFGCEFVGSALTLISGPILRAMTWESPVEIKEDGSLRIYERPMPGHTYAMGVDVATGQGGDAQAFSVIDVTEFPFRQVAVYNNNMLYYTRYPDLLYRVGKFYNDAYILIEVNDVGQSVSYAMQVEIGYENLIKVKPKGKQGQMVSGGFTKMVQYGLKTTTASKRIGCAALKTLVESHRLIIHDWHTIQELYTFVEHKDSFAADEGSTSAKDDIAMSLVLFGWLSDQLFFKDSVGKNLRINLQEEMDRFIDQDFVPFGFIDDGLDHTPETATDEANNNPQPWNNAPYRPHSF